MAFFVPTANQTEDFLSQPTIDGAQLTDVSYVLQVVVDDRDVTNTPLDSVGCDGGQRARPLPRIGDFRPASSFSSKCEPEKILDFPPLVAGK